MVPHFNAEHLHIPVSGHWRRKALETCSFIAITTFISAGTRRADSQGHAGGVDLHGGGDCEPDFSGDGGLATSAAIDISAIAVDGLGDGFIAEPGMPGICEITPA